MYTLRIIFREMLEEKCSIPEYLQDMSNKRSKPILSGEKYRFSWNWSKEHVYDLKDTRESERRPSGMI